MQCFIEPESGPVAWGVKTDGRVWLAVYSSKSEAKHVAMHYCNITMPGSRYEVLPLYRQPKFTATAEELEALDWVTVGESPFPDEEKHRLVLKGLLEKLKCQDVIAS